MNEVDYTKNVKQFMEETNRLNEKQSEWAQRILFLSATLFGVLISLQTTTAVTQSAHLCFSISTSLLAIGCLLQAIVLYGHLEVQKRTRKLYHQELLSAFHNGCAMQPVFAKARKVFVVCEPIAYIVLGLSIVSLSVYSFLI